MKCFGPKCSSHLLNLLTRRMEYAVEMVAIPLADLQAQLSSAKPI